MQQKLIKIRSVIILSACVGVIAFSFHQDRQIQIERQYEPCGGAPEFLEERIREDRNRDLTDKVIPGIIAVGAIADYITTNGRKHEKERKKKNMRKIRKFIVPAFVLANIGAIYCSYKFEPETEPGQPKTKKDILRRLFLRNIPEAILAELILGYISVWQERKMTCEDSKIS